MSDEQARHAFGCPSLPESQVSEWFCYGVRVNGSPGKRVAPGVYELPLRAIENPAKFFIAGDSVLLSGRQTFRIIPPGLYAEGGIHLRHQGLANILFLDGHVEALDAAGLYQLGITEAINGDGEVIQTKPTDL